MKSWSERKKYYQLSKTNKITINYLHKNKRDVLIESSEAGLLWLAKYIKEIASGKRNTCENSISPYSKGEGLFTSHSDLGLYIHRTPCAEERKPLKGYSEKAARKKYYASLPTTFSSIYSRIIKLWPEKIKLKAQKSYGATPTTLGDSVWFPPVANCWNEVEESVYDSFDFYGGLAVFAMYQAFATDAHRIWKSGKKVLHTRKVSKKLIEEKLWSNLQAKCWWRERKRYIRK